MKYEKIYGIFITSAVAALLIFAIAVPMQGLRKSALDSQTVSALSKVKVALESYMTKNGEVPTSVNELSFNSGSQPSEDVLKRISIKKDGNYDYELCATFYTDTKQDLESNTTNQPSLMDIASSYSSSSYNYSNFAKHDAGEYCFSETDTYYDWLDTWSSYYDNSDYDLYDDNSDSISTIEGVEAKARDTKRQTDIKALHSQLEAYAAQNNGEYPVPADLNDVDWRAYNLRGLDEVALCDPGSDLETGCVLLVNDTPSTDGSDEAYSYQVWETDGTTVCANLTTGNTCVKYTLTADLENPINGSGAYVKNSLN